MNRPVYRAVAEIGEYFADHPNRPLVIDEADFLVKRGMIEIVRAIYKYCATAGASIVLIGEENLPKALKMWERVDSRVLKAVRAEALDRDDVRLLSEIVCHGIRFDDAVLDRLRKVANGSARRVVTRLYDLRELSRINGWETVNLETWNPAEAA